MLSLFGYRRRYTFPKIGDEVQGYFNEEGCILPGRIMSKRKNGHNTFMIHYQKPDGTKVCKSESLPNASVFLSHDLIPSFRTETYSKDSSRVYDPFKQEINLIIALWVRTHLKQRHKRYALYLDGPHQRTGKALQKIGIRANHCCVPNNTWSTYKSLYNSRSVLTWPISLGDFVKQTTQRFSVLYLDTCGQFNQELREVLQQLFQKDLIHTDPLAFLGITITTRSCETVQFKHQVLASLVCFVQIQARTHQYEETFLTWRFYGSMVTVFWTLKKTSSKNKRKVTNKSDSKKRRKTSTQLVKRGQQRCTI